VNFDFDRYVIRPDARTKLDDSVGKLRDVTLEVVIAVGHADRLGSDAYNMKLSVRRADSVKAYLVSKGIAASRVYTEGKGERQPVKECKGDKKTKELIACLEPNRRVDLERWARLRSSRSRARRSPASAGLFYLSVRV